MSVFFLRVLFTPVRMIMVPPRHYCVVLNPVARDDDKQVLFDQSGQAKLRHADLEIRLTQDPFPLYPGEEVQLVCTRTRSDPRVGLSDKRSNVRFLCDRT